MSVAPECPQTADPAIAVVGGGLAGLAAAVALTTAGCRVELFEARRWLGGRAGSFRDPSSGETIDHCQHVSMGCCTNLADFCRRVGAQGKLTRERTLYFVGPDGRVFPFRGDRWLPAPLHLARRFWGLKFLSTRDRLGIARAMWRLIREPAAGDREITVGQWLRRQNQSQTAIRRYWSVILVSALGEDLDRASYAAARKVMIDGFIAAADAYTVEIPATPLSELYGDRLLAWLQGQGVVVHLGASIRQVRDQPKVGLSTGDGQERAFDAVVLAVPWAKLADVVDASVASRWPWLADMTAVPASPISGVHLWFDRPIMPLPHAVLIDRLSQWVFARGNTLSRVRDPGEHYYQVVISASRQLAGRDRQQVVNEVCGELADIWPEARDAKLLRWRLVTDSSAVFSATPGLECIRPQQATAVAGIYVAGDWTATDWPATMESAVRSGYLAAEAVLASVGRPQRFLVPDLPRSWLARCIVRDR